MELANLRIANYKGLRAIDFPLSRFGCIIGENNAGKSSLLQALSLLVSGTKLSREHFFDPSKEIRIALQLVAITEADLVKLEEGHRTKIEPIIKNDGLTLVRKYGLDGRSALKYETLVPAHPEFQTDYIANLLRGKRPSAATRDLVVGTYPELETKVTAQSTQSEIKEAIMGLADSMSDESKVPVDADLPTGIDASIKALLPTIIYIPAVKDLGDDIKTKEGTPFGRVMKILLQAIEPELTAAKELFEQLDRKLNRQRQPDGSVEDGRLAQVKTIESTVEKYLQECFANVRLEIEIPRPDIKTILSSARIFADDGVRGEIDTKGDGLRRATVFSILRAYVELNKPGSLEGEIAPDRPNDYLLLFEEPELYLHPNAQLILFRALSLFSGRHTVVVTTHSPIFFGPEGTATFVKMRKDTDATIADRPFGIAHCVSFLDFNAKDQFQLICFENNNAAFFASTVVLVEGDSDYIVFPHIANLVCVEWGALSASIRFARIGGKANINRYREFFNRFNMRVVVLADLDVLVDGFEKLGVSVEVVQQRVKLLELVDAVIQGSGETDDASTSELEKLATKGDAKAMWLQSKAAWLAHVNDGGPWEAVVDAVESFFAYERKKPRLKVLEQSSTYPNVHEAKQKLLRSLRGCDIFVLCKGDIEAYYPPGVTGHDKPTQAQSFCATVGTREVALAACEQQMLAVDGSTANEFELFIDLVLNR